MLHFQVASRHRLNGDLHVYIISDEHNFVSELSTVSICINFLSLFSCSHITVPIA